jgi:2,4-diaminopentanoate dehydrogenase
MQKGCKDMSVKVIQYGCGAIGCSIVRLVTKKQNIDIVGAVDIINIGRDLGDIAGLDRMLGVTISNDAESILREYKPDVILHATSSFLSETYPQLEQCIRAGANIISTCEELSYPYRKQLGLASALDKLAKDYQVTVLGTGVNPGFLMDSWPLFMTGVCQDVNHITVVRIQDASVRRISFQKKIGAGKSVEEFKKLVDTGTLRHIGLSESIAMFAEGLGWELDDITETVEPIIADTEVCCDFVTLKPGQVIGVKQVGRGFIDSKELVTLDFQAYLGAKESYDAVYIDGRPNMEVLIKGGINGDIATAAIVVNSVKRVIEAPPGLITMKDLPIVCALPNI